MYLMIKVTVILKIKMADSLEKADFLPIIEKKINIEFSLHFTNIILCLHNKMQ